MITIKKHIKEIAQDNKALLTALTTAFFPAQLFNIQSTAKGTKFDYIYGYLNHIEASLTIEEELLFDLFGEFGSPKNASHIICNLIDTKKSITEETYENAKKITCTREDFPKFETFFDFRTYLKEQKQLAKAIQISQQWAKDFRLLQSSFRCFAINSGKDILKNEDIILITAHENGMLEPAMVVDTQEGGFIQVIHRTHTTPFALSTGYEHRKAVKGEVRPEELADLKEIYSELSEDYSIVKGKFQDKALKLAEKQAEADKKTADREARAEANSKAKTERNEAVEEILTTTYKSEKAIEAGIEKANAIKDKTLAQQGKINAHMKRQRKELQAKDTKPTTTPKGDNKKATAEAGEPIKGTTPEKPKTTPTTAGRRSTAKKKEVVEA